MPRAPLALPLRIIALLAAVASAGQAPAAGVPKEPITYERFAQLVATSHPEKPLTEMNVALARQAAGRAGRLPDPQLSISRDDAPLPDYLQPMMPAGEEAKGRAEWRLGIMQQIPWPGTLRAEDRAAQARIAAAETEAGVSTLERQFAAKELFLKIVRTAKLLAAEEASLEEARGLRDLTHARFKQGLGSHLEYLQAHSELGVMKANVRALATDLRNLKRHTLVLLGVTDLRGVDALRLVTDWPAPAAAQAPARDVVRERIARGRDATLARQDVEYRRSLPSLTASGMLMRDDAGMRMYGAALGISLPIYSGAARSALRTESGLIGRRAEGDIAWHDRRKELALAQARDRIEQIEANGRALQSEIISPVREHFAGAMALFSQGKGELGAIIESRRALLGLRMTAVMNDEALALARLAIEKIEAGMVDETLDLGVPQLALPQTAGMSQGGMAATPAMPDGMPDKSMKSTRPRAATPAQPEMEPEPRGGTSGMGM
jgi:outer membrane protein TolC